MITRLISSRIRSSKKSILLLGPRQAGKSTLVQSLKPDFSINLFDELDYLKVSSDPAFLTSEIQTHNHKVIFIDEVQRLPRLLNTVQTLVDKNKNLKFFLTGSNARKLKRGGANLLPGRVFNYYLGPLVQGEVSIANQKALSVGCLPEMYLDRDEENAKLLLKSYVANYIKEEIRAEALTRNLESFARFLNEAVLSAAQWVDYTKIAKNTKVSRHAIPRYFEILEDTLIGSRIHPFDALKEKCDLVRHPKFYLFDNGIYNGYLKNFIPSADRIGTLAEQLVYSQLLHSSWAYEKDLTLSTFRTRSGIEVDFIATLEDKTFGIEVKSSPYPTASDCEGLLYFKKSFPKAEGLFIAHLGTEEKKLGQVWSMPWQKVLINLGLAS